MGLPLFSPLDRFLEYGDESLFAAKAILNFNNLIRAGENALQRDTNVARSETAAYLSAPDCRRRYNNRRVHRHQLDVAAPYGRSELLPQ